MDPVGKCNSVTRRWKVVCVPAQPQQHQYWSRWSCLLCACWVRQAIECPQEIAHAFVFLSCFEWHGVLNGLLFANNTFVGWLVFLRPPPSRFVGSPMHICGLTLGLCVGADGPNQFTNGSPYSPRGRAPVHGWSRYEEMMGNENTEPRSRAFGGGPGHSYNSSSGMMRTNVDRGRSPYQPSHAPGQPHGRQPRHFEKTTNGATTSSFAQPRKGRNDEKMNVVTSTKKDQGPKFNAKRKLYTTTVSMMLRLFIARTTPTAPQWQSGSLFEIFGNSDSVIVPFLFFLLHFLWLTLFIC